MSLLIWLVEIVAALLLMAFLWGPILVGMHYIKKGQSLATAPRYGAERDDYLGGVSRGGSFDGRSESFESYDTYEMFDDASDGGGAGE